jgi:ketosteroid isomerase-like protein
MSFEENVEAARRVYEELNRGDLDELLAFVAPDVEFCIDAPIAGAAKVYRGHDGIRAYLADVREAVDGLTVELRDFIDAGGDRIVVEATARIVGRASGIEAEDHGYEVLTLRGGKLARREHYRDRAQALAAVGLSES